MYLIDVAAIGTILLILYIFIDLFRSRKKPLVKRVIFYSFLFYLVHVAQLTTGGIYLPPMELSRYAISIQLVPFKFFTEWLSVYDRLGIGWHLWYAIRLSFYNLLMLIPLGMYLPILFRFRNMIKVGFLAALLSLGIETMQLILTYFGFTQVRTFNVDDIILNTTGALIGFLFYKILFQRWIHRIVH